MHAHLLLLETTKGLIAAKFEAIIRTQMTKHSASSASPVITVLTMTLTTMHAQLALGHLGLRNFVHYAFLDSSAHLQLNRIQMLVCSELMRSTLARFHAMSALRTMNV